MFNILTHSLTHSLANKSGTITFRNDKTEYYVVGTAYILEGEEEASKGRLIVFSVRTDLRQNDDDDDDEMEEEKEEAVNQLIKVIDITINGAPYTLHAFQGHLVAGIGADVVMFEWISSDEQGQILQKICRCDGHFISLIIRSRGDYIAVADLMKSVRVLKFNSETQTLNEIAKDSNCNWMCALACLSNSTFLGADDTCNLFTVALNQDAKTEEEMARLLVVGEYHLGYSVNKFCEGSLVMQALDQKKKDDNDYDDEKKEEDEDNQNAQPRPRLMFGTVSGMIGVVISLSQRDYNVLKSLQRAMTKVIKGIGGLEHEDWRSFKNEFRRTPVQSTGFIDGDMVELFLDPDVTSETRKEILQTMSINTSEGDGDISEVDLLALVRKLSRMH
jgi:DNA damage-binding protein 1